jgi:hypothetical protein
MNTYLLLLSILLLVSFVLYYKSSPMRLWRATLPAVFGAGVIFMVAMLVLKGKGVLTYDLRYFSGADNLGIPYEVILGAFVFPFAGISIYSFLNLKFPAQTYEKYSLALSNILMGLCIAMIFFAYTKWYPVFTFGLMMVTLFIVEYKNKIRFMYRFYRTYLVLLLAYLAVVVQFHYAGCIGFHEQHTIRFRLVYVPFESFFLLFSIVLISILLFEVFKRRYRLDGSQGASGGSVLPVKD